MPEQTLLQKVDEFSSSSGVYLMKEEGGKIIYVGKARNVRQRVRQYLLEHDTRPQVAFLMRKVRDIDVLLTSTETEALLLENSLIKKHRPRYNISLKDDKTYISLRLSVHHPFPDLSLTRKIRRDKALYFGPYISAQACRETVDFIYRHFQLRTCSDHEFKHRSRPCLEYQIKRCSAPCVGYVNQEDYGRQVEEVRLFLEGRNEELVRLVKKRMEEAAFEERFEAAAHFRNLLSAIEQTLEKQKVARHLGVHQDFIGLYREGFKGMISLLSVREGSLIDSRYFPIDAPRTDEEVLKEFLEQYYLKDVFLPDEIFTPLPLSDMEAWEEVVEGKKGKRIVFRSPQRGEKREMMDLAVKNAQAQYARVLHKELDNVDALTRLQVRLNLPKPPHRLECYDISNISGEHATASRVVFIDGIPDKKLYRHYRIRYDEGPNDYEMLREVMRRRFGKGAPTLTFPPEGGGNLHSCGEEPQALPDLLVIDGGRGQVSAVKQILDQRDLGHLPLIGIAKGKGEGARAKGLWADKKEEEIYLPNRKNPVILRRGSPELMLLQRLRDEAHRFALKYHRKLREKI